MSKGKLLSIPLVVALYLFSFAHPAPFNIGKETYSEDESLEDTSMPFDYDEAHNFIKNEMKKYGYLKKRSSPMEFKAALKNFQEVLEIEESGEVDEQTMAAALKPRCSQTDILHTSSRFKRFSLSKRSKWSKKHFTLPNSISLTWCLSEFTTDMSPVETRRIVKKVFDIWTSQSNIRHEKKIGLNFEEASSKDDCDINIMFATGHHGDEYAVCFSKTTRDLSLKIFILRSHIISFVWTGNQYAKIPKCTTSNVEKITRRNIKSELQLNDEDVKHYTIIVCNFLAGLQLWKNTPQYNPINSLEDQFRENQQTTLVDGTTAFRRLIRHAKHLQESSRRSPLDEDFFNNNFFESFMAEYENN
ncbi:hypothetical protein CRE_08489 [Caenorhabditis remanei]|uniref:Peptidase M10 metallopeptidase domain-containing protein n=1 Tax=Caenorhabditis remanei TaxID=31234 RepID=E3N6V9_CAERE|nr:hypothetical protein CRE_08489 [Caenorhabditis remanei]